MKDLSVTKAKWESSRFNSISFVEELEPEEMEYYVRDFLLPNLQQSYNQVKDYISNNTRRNIYTVKKHLADLIKNQDVVRISTNEDRDSSNLSRFGASYLINESLNDIYLFSSVMKSKITPSDSNSQMLFTLNRLSKDVCNLQKEIKESIEQQARSCCLKF
ncbi:hypothetical protein [Acetivibrio clariflavus]|uniref:Uncharacterized protein n=1 Tax=Acetivibrio clariflavus (strain DSM 19732 / NBRC 101661 / EBR45) TaxID=720554 RepID=G8LW82_ACECE|nr:hypothetical protein [Acetivibrio clariflavus]AEV69729.1 hypothetical protein Clocl_3213 [Acetivibrio clariflavus DSM 19732]HOQ01370.1 hypothetical protein [Acetivibrio clariflavus]HPU41154.1 hypothetical protein [Acetivibrio clariflavus]